MSFSVVINSVNNYSGVAANANKSSLQFAIDWSFLPEGKYKMGYNFLSRPTANNDMLFIQIPDMGCDFHSYTAATTTSSFSNKILGLATQWYGLTSYASSMFSQYLNNPPIFLSSKPSSNIFTVNLLQYDAVTPYTNGGAWTNFDYTLILYFELVQ